MYGVELDSEGSSCQLALNINNFKDVTSLISNLYQLAQARPHNVLYFLVDTEFCLWVNNLIVLCHVSLINHCVVVPATHTGSLSTWRCDCGIHSESSRGPVAELQCLTNLFHPSPPSRSRCSCGSWFTAAARGQWKQRDQEERCLLWADAQNW